MVRYKSEARKRWQNSYLYDSVRRRYVLDDGTEIDKQYFMDYLEYLGEKFTDYEPWEIGMYLRLCLGWKERVNVNEQHNS